MIQMNNSIRESIANINYYIDDTRQRVSDTMFALEQKELIMESYYDDPLFLQREVLNIYDDIDVFVEAFADYDFINHNSSQGENNLAFAKALCRIIEASDDYHKKTIAAGRSIGSIQLKGKENNNTLKYEKLGQLVKEYATLHPNYATLTVVSDDLGKDPKSGNPSLVIFVKMIFDNEEYWVCWHVMDPNNTKQANHKQKNPKLKTRMKSYDVLKSYNHPSFKKLVKNNNTDDTSEYLSLEREYKNVPFDHRGDATHTMLINKFNIAKNAKNTTGA